MGLSPLPLPPVEPTVLLVDASPLIHLAMADALDLPLRFEPVVVPDAVEIEATFDPTKPFAAEIRTWLDANQRRAGRNRWVERPVTEIGELLKIAIEMRRPRPRTVGEHAIINWLADNVSNVGAPALIVYENGRTPNMLVREGLPEDVIVVTSRTFLALAADAGFVEDAEAVWSRIVARNPRAKSGDELPVDTRAQGMTDAEREDILRRYVDLEITAEEAADRLGPRTSVSEVILATRQLFGRLPDRRDAFTEGEARRARRLLGLA